MAIGRRCDAGCETWPDSDVYKRCPICGEETDRFRNLVPLTEGEALSRRLEVEFQEFYANWCARKGYSDDGPLPMTKEEMLVWEDKYPGGRPDPREPSS